MAESNAPPRRRIANRPAAPGGVIAGAGRFPALSRALLLACAMLVLPPGAGAAFAEGGAVLQGLDKVTARIFTFDAPIDKPVRFGRLQIVARACHKTPPEEPPESAAFLDITELPPDGEPRRLFTGWMFASSPALSALEHPVYDIWVVDCMNDSSSSSPSSP